MTLSEEINRMILTALENAEWTSASPGFINTLIQVNTVDNPDLERLLKENSEIESKGESSQFSKEAISKNKNKKLPFEDTDLKGFVQNFSKEDAQGVLSKAGISPQSTADLLRMSTSGVGIQGALIGSASRIIPPAAIALMVSQLIPAIINELARPGGLMDKRVRIDALNETRAELDRQTRQNTRIGDRQVIIQQFNGFRNFDGYASTSTGELIIKNADRVLDIGLFDRAQGISQGGT